ncbi:phosphate ABC transporter substrate-binding protein PstS [Streptomyces sp. B6B3]|uniref:phosphate ABC transporter substrate-binding protein PstS n=1 Tax=Streptomyces sp. B6B3 TaxID=3153570 RepID=UPI00325F4DF4
MQTRLVRAASRGGMAALALGTLVSLLSLTTLTGCRPGGDGGDGALTRGSLSGQLSGSGATFPDPVFQEWLDHYTGSVETGVAIDYRAVGSGGGIEQFLAQSVDFGSSERYLQASELAVARDVRGCPAVQFPVLFGSVVIALNDPALDDMVLTADVLARIYDRQITRYDDPALVALNPDLDLPDEEIRPVHRSDGSGTTYVLSHYLTEEVPFWADEYAEGTDIGWHAGTLEGEGNEGVAGTVLDSAGGLGYVNQSYALEHDLATARVVNADGHAIEPTLEATTIASEEAEADIPDNFQFNVDGVGGQGYPIVGATWILAYSCGYAEEVGTLLRDFWDWAVNDTRAAAVAEDLGYARMGPELRDRVTEEIRRVNAD